MSFLKFSMCIFLLAPASSYTVSLKDKVLSPIRSFFAHQAYPAMPTVNQYGRTPFEARLDNLWMSKPVQKIANFELPIIRNSISWATEKIASIPFLKNRIVNETQNDEVVVEADNKKITYTVPQEWLIGIVEKIAQEMNIDISKYQILVISHKKLVENNSPNAVAAAFVDEGKINNQLTSYMAFVLNTTKDNTDILYYGNKIEDINLADITDQEWRESDHILNYIIRHELTHIKHNDVKTANSIITVGRLSVGMALSYFAILPIMNKMVQSQSLINKNNKILNFSISILAGFLGSHVAGEGIAGILRRFSERRADTIATYSKPHPEALLKVMVPVFSVDRGDGYLTGKEFGNIADKFIKEGKIEGISKFNKKTLLEYHTAVEALKNDSTVSAGEKDKKISELLLAVAEKLEL